MTCLIYDDIYLRHHTGAHPERKERLEAVLAYLNEEGLADQLRRVAPRAAAEEDIAAVHERRHIETVKAACQDAPARLDLDTPVSALSYQAALHAAGGLLEAADRVMAGECRNAFCLVRPPGHHATPRRAMGFCLFNNVAVAARYVQRKHGVSRVLIVDWDVHHGNGTEEIFYQDGSVFYFSTHRWPFYPGTGAPASTGEGDGAGATLNKPLPYGTTPEEFLAAFRAAMEGPCREFAPEFVFISAGFDAYEGDPIAGLGLRPQDFRTLTDLVAGLAQETAQGRIVSALEGGYDLDGLARCVGEHVAGLLAAAGE